MKWKVFLEGYLFSTINCDGTFEVDTKKMDIDAFIQGESPKKRKDITFIWIGVLHAKSPRKIEMQKDSDGQLIVIPPRLNGLRIKQQSFRQFTLQYNWNYILDNNADEDHKDEDDGEDKRLRHQLTRLRLRLRLRHRRHHRLSSLLSPSPSPSLSSSTSSSSSSLLPPPPPPTPLPLSLSLS
jgi:hypothetical protein